MIHQGGCHCGKVAFEVEGDMTNVIECNCSHCVKKGFLLAFVPRDKLKLTTPEENMSTYTFNKHVIKHMFCATCGTQPLGFGVDPKGNVSAAINVRCLSDFDPSKLTIQKVDGKSF